MKSHDWVFLMFTTIICCTTTITIVQAQQRGRVKFGLPVQKDEVGTNASPEIVNLPNPTRGSVSHRASSRFRAAIPSAIPSTQDETKESPRSSQRGSRGRSNDRSSRKLTAEATEAIPLVRTRKRIIPATPSTSSDQPTKIELPTSSVDRTNVIRRSKTRSEPSSSTSPPASVSSRRRSDVPLDGPTENIRKVRTFTSRSVTKQDDEVISSESPLTVATTSNWKNVANKRGASKVKSSERKSKALDEDQLEDENYPEHFKLLLRKQQPSPALLPKNYPKLPVQEDPTYSKSNEIYEAPRVQGRPRRLEQTSQETSSDEILQVSRAIPKVRRVELKREDTARAALKSRRIEQPRLEPNIETALKNEEPSKSRRSDSEKLRAQVRINKAAIKSRKKEPSNEVKYEDIPKVPSKSNRRIEPSTQDNEPEVKPNEIEESTRETKPLFLPRRAEPYRPKPKTTTQRPTTTSKPIKKPEVLAARAKFKNRFNSRLQFPSLRTKASSTSDEPIKYDNEVIHTSPAPQPVRPLQITKSRNLAFDRPIVDARPKPKQNKFSSRYRGDAFSRYQQKSEPSKPIYTPTIPALTTEPMPSPQFDYVTPRNLENNDLNKSGSNFEGIVYDEAAGVWNMVEPVAGGLTRSEISVESGADEQPLPQSSVTVSIYEALADILLKTPPTTTSTTTTTTTSTTTSTTELPDIIQVPEQKIDSISSTTVNTHDPITEVMDDENTTNTNAITNNDRDGRLLNSVEINPFTTIITPTTTISIDPNDSLKTITVPYTSDTTLLFRSQTEQTTPGFTDLTTLSLPFASPTQPTLTNTNLTNISTNLLELTTLASNPPTSLPMPFLADALTTPGSSLITRPQLISAISNFLDTSVQNASETMATTTENTTKTTTPATLDTNSTPTEASTTFSPPITTIFSSPSTGSPPVTISFLDLFTIQAKKVNQNTQPAIEVHPIYKGPESTTTPIDVQKKQTTGRPVNINTFFGTQTYPSISITGSTSTDRTSELTSTFREDAKVTGGVTTDTAIPSTSTLEQDTSTILEYTTSPQSSIRTQSLPIHLNSILGSTQKYDQTSPFKTVQTEITTTIRSRFGNKRIPILPAGSYQSTTNKISTSTQTISSTTTPVSTTANVTQVSPENKLKQQLSNDTTTTTITTEQKPIQDFSVYGILPNNTVVRKRPPQVTRQLDIGIMVYGILPNQTVVRKYPNGTLMIVDSSKDVEVVDIDPKMLFNPFSELYRTSQSSFLLTTHRSTTSQRFIESNHILSSSSSTDAPNNSPTAGSGSSRMGNSIKETTESGNTDSTLTTNTDDENLIQWLSENEDNILNSTILFESNTENAVLLDLLKRKYIKTDLPSRSENVVSLTTVRNNVVEENSIQANKQEDVSENTSFDSSEEKQKDSVNNFFKSKDPVIPNRLNNNNDDENLISQQFDTSYANVGIGRIFPGNKGRINNDNPQSTKLYPIQNEMDIPHTTTKLFPINTLTSSNHAVVQKEFLAEVVNRTHGVVVENPIDGLLTAIPKRDGESKFIDFGILESEVDSEANSDYFMDPEDRLKIVQYGFDFDTGEGSGNSDDGELEGFENSGDYHTNTDVDEPKTDFDKTVDTTIGEKVNSEILKVDSETTTIINDSENGNIESPFIHIVFPKDVLESSEKFSDIYTTVSPLRNASTLFRSEDLIPSSKKKETSKASQNQNNSQYLSTLGSNVDKFTEDTVISTTTLRSIASEKDIAHEISSNSYDKELSNAFAFKLKNVSLNFLEDRNLGLKNESLHHTTSDSLSSNGSQYKTNTGGFIDSDSKISDNHHFTHSYVSDNISSTKNSFNNFASVDSNDAKDFVRPQHSEDDITSDSGPNSNNSSESKVNSFNFFKSTNGFVISDLNGKVPKDENQEVEASNEDSLFNISNGTENFTENKFSVPETQYTIANDSLLSQDVFSRFNNTHNDIFTVIRDKAFKGMSNQKDSEIVEDHSPLGFVEDFEHLNVEKNSEIYLNERLKPENNEAGNSSVIISDSGDLSLNFQTPNTTFKNVATLNKTDSSNEVFRHGNFSEISSKTDQENKVLRTSNLEERSKIFAESFKESSANSNLKPEIIPILNSNSFQSLNFASNDSVTLVGTSMSKNEELSLNDHLQEDVDSQIITVADTSETAGNLTEVSKSTVDSEKFLIESGIDVKTNKNEEQVFQTENQTNLENKEIISNIDSSSFNGINENKEVFDELFDNLYPHKEEQKLYENTIVTLNNLSKITVAFNDNMSSMDERNKPVEITTELKKNFGNDFQVGLSIDEIEPTRSTNISSLKVESSAEDFIGKQNTVNVSLFRSELFKLLSLPEEFNSTTESPIELITKNIEPNLRPLILNSEEISSNKSGSFLTIQDNSSSTNKSIEISKDNKSANISSFSSGEEDSYNQVDYMKKTQNQTINNLDEDMPTPFEGSDIRSASLSDITSDIEFKVSEKLGDEYYLPISDTQQIENEVEGIVSKNQISSTDSTLVEESHQFAPQNRTLSNDNYFQQYNNQGVISPSPDTNKYSFNTIYGSGKNHSPELESPELDSLSNTEVKDFNVSNEYSELPFSTLSGRIDENLSAQRGRDNIFNTSKTQGSFEELNSALASNETNEFNDSGFKYKNLINSELTQDLKIDSEITDNRDKPKEGFLEVQNFKQPSNEDSVKYHYRNEIILPTGDVDSNNTKSYLSKTFENNSNSIESKYFENSSNSDINSIVSPNKSEDLIENPSTHFYDTSNMPEISPGKEEYQQNYTFSEAARHQEKTSKIIVDTSKSVGNDQNTLGPSNKSEFWSISQKEYPGTVEIEFFQKNNSENSSVEASNQYYSPNVGNERIAQKFSQNTNISEQPASNKDIGNSSSKEVWTSSISSEIVENVNFSENQLNKSLANDFSLEDSSLQSDQNYSVGNNGSHGLASESTKNEILNPNASISLKTENNISSNLSLSSGSSDKGLETDPRKGVVFNSTEVTESDMSGSVASIDLSEKMYSSNKGIFENIPSDKNNKGKFQPELLSNMPRVLTGTNIHGTSSQISPPDRVFTTQEPNSYVLQNSVQEEINLSQAVKPNGELTPTYQGSIAPKELHLYDFSINSTDNEKNELSSSFNVGPEVQYSTQIPNLQSADQILEHQFETSSIRPTPSKADKDRVSKIILELLNKSEQERRNISDNSIFNQNFEFENFHKENSFNTQNKNQPETLNTVLTENMQINSPKPTNNSSSNASSQEFSKLPAVFYPINSPKSITHLSDKLKPDIVMPTNINAVFETTTESDQISMIFPKDSMPTPNMALPGNLHQKYTKERLHKPLLGIIPSNNINLHKEHISISKTNTVNSAKEREFNTPLKPIFPPSYFEESSRDRNRTTLTPISIVETTTPVSTRNEAEEVSHFVPGGIPIEFMTNTDSFMLPTRSSKQAIHKSENRFVPGGVPKEVLESMRNLPSTTGPVFTAETPLGEVFSHFTSNTVLPVQISSSTTPAPVETTDTVFHKTYQFNLKVLKSTIEKVENDVKVLKETFIKSLNKSTNLIDPLEDDEFHTKSMVLEESHSLLNSSSDSSNTSQDFKGFESESLTNDNITPLDQLDLLQETLDPALATRSISNAPQNLIDKTKLSLQTMMKNSEFKPSNSKSVYKMSANALSNAQTINSIMSETTDDSVSNSNAQSIINNDDTKKLFHANSGQNLYKTPPFSETPQQLPSEINMESSVKLTSSEVPYIPVQNIENHNQMHTETHNTKQQQNTYQESITIHPLDNSFVIDHLKTSINTITEPKQIERKTTPTIYVVTPVYMKTSTEEATTQSSTTPIRTTPSTTTQSSTTPSSTTTSTTPSTTTTTSTTPSTTTSTTPIATSTTTNTTTPIPLVLEITTTAKPTIIFKAPSTTSSTIVNSQSPPQTNTALSGANSELEKNIKLLEQLLQLQASLKSKPSSSLTTTSSTPSTTTTTTTTTTAQPKIIAASSSDDEQFIKQLRQLLLIQQQASKKTTISSTTTTPPPTTTTTTTRKPVTISPQNLQELLNSFSTPSHTTTSVKPIDNSNDIEFLNSLRELGKIQVTTSAPTTFANRIIELALKNRVVKPTSPVFISTTVPPFVPMPEVNFPQILPSKEIEKHRQDEASLSSDLSLLSTLLGRRITIADLPQITQQFGGNRAKPAPPPIRRTTTTTTTPRTTRTTRPTTTTTEKPMTRDEIAEIEKNLSLLSSLLGRQVSLNELPLIMQELRSGRKPKGNAPGATINFITPAPFKPTTTNQPRPTVSLQSQTPISQEEVIELLKDPALSSPEQLNIYGKTNDAILAAVLKQRGIGPAHNNLPVNDLFGQAQPQKPYRPTRPPPPPPPQRRPVLDGLAWLWRTWQETAAPGNRVSKSNRQPTASASTRLESPLIIGAFGGEAPAPTVNSNEGGEYADLQYPQNPSFGQGNGLLTAAFGVTRAVSQFLGAAFQGAAKSVQSAFSPQAIQQPSLISLSG